MKSLIFALAAIAAVPAFAADFSRIEDRGAFLGLVSGKQLSTRSATLEVLDSGEIQGRWNGLRVNGSWSWEGDLFCRTLSASHGSTGRDCQVVQQNGRTLRFIANEGAGDFVDFLLK